MPGVPGHQIHLCDHQHHLRSAVRDDVHDGARERAVKVHQVHHDHHHRLVTHGLELGAHVLFEGRNPVLMRELGGSCSSLTVKRLPQLCWVLVLALNALRASSLLCSVVG
jgi:hypothetical protein